MKPIRINLVTTAIPKRQIFNDYLLCLFEYTHWLSAQGHQVNFVPMAPSRYPEWFGKDIGTLVSQPRLDAYATPGEDAEIVPARDIENIAEGFCRVVTDLEYRIRLSVNGLRKYQEYTWDRTGATLQRILTQPWPKASVGLAASGG